MYSEQVFHVVLVLHIEHELDFYLAFNYLTFQLTEYVEQTLMRWPIIEFSFLCSFCEEFQRVLVYDWLLLFIQGNLHQFTVILALSVLVRMLQHPVLLQAFREGSGGGGWLKETEPVVQNRIGVLLGKFNLSKCFSHWWHDSCQHSFQHYMYPMKK